MYHVCICLGQFTNFSWVQILRGLPIDIYARASSTSESNPFQCAHHSRHLTTNHTQPDYARQHIILGNFVKDVSGFFTDHHDRPILDCANSSKFVDTLHMPIRSAPMVQENVCTTSGISCTSNHEFTIFDCNRCSAGQKHTSTIAYIAMSYIAVTYCASKHVELLTKDT